MCRHAFLPVGNEWPHVNKVSKLSASARGRSNHNVSGIRTANGIDTNRPVECCEGATGRPVQIICKYVHNDLSKRMCNCKLGIIAACRSLRSMTGLTLLFNVYGRTMTRRSRACTQIPGLHVNDTMGSIVCMSVGRLDQASTYIARYICVDQIQLHLLTTLSDRVSCLSLAVPRFRPLRDLHILVHAGTYSK